MNRVVLETQAENDEARRTGGPLHCPTCKSELWHQASTDAYFCQPCRFMWSHTGHIIPLKGQA